MKELTLALAGLDAARQVLDSRKGREQGTAPQPESGQPVFGMPGRRFDPQGGFR